jgi:hypothetical protein
MGMRWPQSQRQPPLYAADSVAKRGGASKYGADKNSLAGARAKDFAVQFFVGFAAVV